MKPIVFGHTQGLDVQASTVASPTIRANGGGLAVVVFAPDAMVSMGGNVWEGIMPTLNAFDKTGDSRATVLIIDGTRVDDVRIYDDEITPCLKNRMGTGGNNVPMIATEQETTHDVVGTLQAGYRKGANHEAARDGQLIIGHGQTADSEAIPIQGTMIGRQDHNAPGGVGAGERGAPIYTLETISTNAVEHNTVVRRLTPIECERLMGWPDNHTLHRADGKTNADSSRYKMCGNGVASPVAEWIGRQILAWEASETAL